MDALLHAVKAASDPTRLRILVVLASSELSVGQICTVLGQSQPRVSRHLKILADAGLLDRHAEGTSAYYRRARGGLGRQVYDALVELIDPHDRVIEADSERLSAVRAERAHRAAEYFEEVAGRWDELRERHVADWYVEQAMMRAVADIEIADLLDIGTGTGRMLELFAGRIQRGLGIDASQKMLTVARSRLSGSGIVNCAVRPGDAHDLGVGREAFDVALIHHVLHFLDEPARAVAQAAEALRPGGRLLIVDFAPHQLEALRIEDAHVWLGFDDHELTTWCSDSGLDQRETIHLVPTEAQGTDALTVTLWVAERPGDHTIDDLAL